MKKYNNFLKENKENNFIEELKNVLYGDKIFYNAITDLNFGDNLEDLNGFDIDPDTKSISWKLKNENIIDNILGIEVDILRYINSINEYGFEMDIDNDEKEYISNHMNEKTINMIKEFAKELNYELNYDKDNIFNFLNDIGLDTILTSYITELSYINERGMSKLKKDIFDKNDVFYYDSYEKTFNVNIEELYKYIKNEKNIKTLEDALISVCLDFPYSYEIEYNELYDYLDYKELPNNIEKEILYYYDEYIKDEYWVEIIRTNNIDVFKKYYKINDWSEPLSIYYNYKLIFSMKNLDPSEYNFSDKIYNFVYSEEFFNNIKDDFKDDLETYNNYYTKMRKLITKKTVSRFNL